MTSQSRSAETWFGVVLPLFFATTLAFTKILAGDEAPPGPGEPPSRPPSIQPQSSPPSSRQPSPGAPAGAVAQPTLTPEQKLVVEQATADLASEDFSQRELATAAILKVGPPALSVLEAFKSNDAEQNYRIGAILPLLRERRATAQGTLRGHTRPILGLVMSPDGKRLASSSGQTANRPSSESEVWVWDVAKQKVAVEMSDAGGPVRSITWSACGTWIGGAVLGSDAHLWDATTGEIYRRLRTDGLASRSFAFVPNTDPAAPPERALVGMENGTVVLFDLKSGREVRRWPALAEAMPTDVWMSPDGLTAYAATSLQPATMVHKQLQGIQVDQQESRKKSPRIDFAVSLIVSCSDELGALDLSGNYVGLPYASQTAKRLLNLPAGGGATALARSVAKKRIAVARQTAWSVYDSDTGRLIQNGGGHQTMIESIAFDPSGETLYTGSQEGRIMVWPVNNW